MSGSDDDQEAPRVDEPEEHRLKRFDDLLRRIGFPES